MTQVGYPPFAPVRCPDCGTELSPALLSCPVCRRLVHGERLNQLASWAKQAAETGNLAGALAAWREALTLLPPDSRQHATVSATVSALTREVDARGLKLAPAGPAPAPGRSTGPGKSHAGAKAAGAAGTLALLLWKLKFAVLFVLGKAKLLLFGLTKASTFFSMLLSIGVYWAAFGWKFAVGLVLSIYVHEMGHVWMLRRYGMKATAPMFIPGIGALIRLQQHPADPREDAMIGLAGPVWGLAAAAFCFGVWLITKSHAWAAIAAVGAWVNLFNLLPVWQLDGGRGFRALSTMQRWIVVAAMGAMVAVSQELFHEFEGLLFVLMGVGVLRIFADQHQHHAAAKGDKVAFYLFIFLVVTLSLLAEIPVPVGAL